MVDIAGGARREGTNRGGRGPDSLTTTRARRLLIAIAATAVIAFLLVYAFAVHTRWGQRLDAAALEGRDVLSARDLHAAARLHTSIDIASITLLGGAIVAVALLRGRLRLAVGAGTVIIGSVGTSEFLKHTLPRPYLGVTDALGSLPSYPSGHTTIALALSVGAIFVAPRRWRAPVAVLGVLFSSAVGCSLVATASHRPSDTIGATLVVTAWAAVAAAVLLRADVPAPRSRLESSPITPLMVLFGIGLLVASFAAAAIGIVAAHYGRLDTIHFGRAFVAASAAITGTILLCASALLIALQTADLDSAANRSPVALDEGARRRR